MIYEEKLSKMEKRVLNATPSALHASDIQFEAIVERNSVSLGHGFELNLTVSPPVLESMEGFKVYEPQVRQEGNTKIFEQILMPETEKITAIPEVSFSFFDPGTSVVNKNEFFLI